MTVLFLGRCAIRAARRRTQSQRRGVDSFDLIKPTDQPFRQAFQRNLPMADATMIAHMRNHPGFIAALDQSGGSTSGALKLYGISESDYDSPTGMFRLMHEMRTRVITRACVQRRQGDRDHPVRTDDGGEIKGRPVPASLWEECGVVPFVKVDKGLDVAARLLSAAGGTPARAPFGRAIGRLRPPRGLRQARAQSRADRQFLACPCCRISATKCRTPRSMPPLGSAEDEIYRASVNKL